VPEEILVDPYLFPARGRKLQEEAGGRKSAGS